MKKLFSKSHDPEHDDSTAPSKKWNRVFWILVAVASLLVFYVLSVGPARQLAFIARDWPYPWGDRVDSMIMTIYSPLIYVKDTIENSMPEPAALMLQRIMEWYVNLWD